MLDKRKKHTMIFLIIVAIMMAVGLVLENLPKEGINKNVIEIPLPEDEHEISAICDMKVNGDTLTLATLTSFDDLTRAVAEIWETSDDGRNWTRLYAKEFCAQKENEQICPMPVFVGDKNERKCVITHAFWEGTNSLYSEQKYYYIPDYRNTEYKEIFKEGQNLKYCIPAYTYSHYEAGVAYSYDIYQPNCVTRTNIDEETYERIEVKNADIITHGFFDENGSYLRFGADYDSGYTTEYVKYDFETGSMKHAPVLKALCIDLETYYDSYGICLDPKRSEDEEAYYYICRKGLYHYDKNGKTLIAEIGFPKEFTGLEFSDELLITDDEELYISYSNFGGNRFEQRLLKVKVK